jgi:hypothetical protein
MNTAIEGQILSPEVWTTTSTICFSSQVDLMSNPDLCFEMVWAREELTFNYATAFVEVSEWIAVNSTDDHVHGMTYYDLNVDNGDEACFDLTCASTPSSYDTKITLRSTDTLNNISCYSLEIKSSNSRVWTLGDRQFSVLFDGSQAFFHSAQSLIMNSGSIILGEQIENQIFEEGSGNISFEENVSAVSFSMEQDSDNVSIGSEYVELAEFCLDFSNNSGVDECFEIVVGRNDLTSEYFSVLTEILTEDDSLAVQEEFTDYNKCTPIPCPDLSSPISNGDVSICEGEPLPAISVEEGLDFVVRWYSTPVGGVPLAQGATYEPLSVGVYYAEFFDQSLNCFSEVRTEVALLEAPLPSLSITSKACSEDQGSYTLIFTTDANSVEADQGTLEKLIGLEWMISNIPSDIDVQLTLTNNLTECDRIENVEAPNCDCQIISEPVSQGSKVACLDSDYPLLSVQLVQENVTADWYTRIEGGTPLVTDQIEYTPNNISGTGEYTYYVESRSLENGCVSNTRTEITLTVLDPPVYAFVGVSCSDNLQTYEATFYSDATMIEANEGVLTNDGNGVWKVSGIPTDANVVLNITSPTGCMINKEISSLACECDDIEASICRGEIITCEGID